MNTAIQESDKLREVKYEQKQEKKYLDLIEESKETQSHQNSQLEWIKQRGFCNNSELEKEEEYYAEEMINPVRVEKEKELETFIAKNTIENCVQRSEEWYNLRKMSFGGSEIANLMGTEAHKSQKQFLNDKITKLNTNQRPTANIQEQNIMDWGTFFEPIHRVVIQDIFKCEIKETSMAEGQGILVGCHQSPDGLSVVRSEYFRKNVVLNELKNPSLLDKEYLTVLWEEKCPSFRKPEIGLVPEHYIGEIKLGLSIFSVCDIGCYSDAIFTMCNFNQMFNCGFNNSIIRKKFTKTSTPLYIGYVQIPCEFTAEIGLKKGDISDLNDAQFALIMDEIRANEFPMEYKSYRYTDSTKDRLKTIIERDIKSDSESSFIFWKLEQITFTAVERSEYFKQLMGMFLSLGRQILKENTNCDIKVPEIFENSVVQKDEEDYAKKLRDFGTLIKQLKIPLHPSNHLDEWFKLNYQSLLIYFNKHIGKDVESQFVLANIAEIQDDGYTLIKKITSDILVQLINKQEPSKYSDITSITANTFYSCIPSIVLEDQDIEELFKTVFPPSIEPSQHTLLETIDTESLENCKDIIKNSDAIPISNTDTDTVMLHTSNISSEVSEEEIQEN